MTYSGDKEIGEDPCTKFVGVIIVMGLQPASESNDREVDGENWDIEAVEERFGVFGFCRGCPQVRGARHPRQRGCRINTTGEQEAAYETGEPEPTFTAPTHSVAADNRMKTCLQRKRSEESESVDAKI